jgi:hypothetical protein
MAESSTSQRRAVQPLEDPRPLRAPPPPPGTFEIGLVLAGAVSAGAYTAGALDFLFEALESWYQAKDNKTPDTPPHNVVIRVISGASAGAITGAVAGAALPYRFPHMRAVTPTAQASSAPFYNAWVKQIDIRDLLTNRDLAGGEAPRSLLDSTKLQQIADTAIGYESAQRAVRPYVADPLRLILTVTNLRGVPYALDLRGNAASAHEMTSHADCMRFAVRGIGSASPDKAWPDEIELRLPKQADGPANPANWKLMGTAALASGAFPVGLLPRALQRPLTDYQYRRIGVPGESGQEEARPILPNWAADTPQTYRFLCVDGGAMDNEPLELARIELAGLLGRNPRKGIEANRAVILVDPFPDPAKLGPEDATKTQLLSLGFSLAVSWKDQARFKPLDLALASDETIYSRYLLAPDRGEGGIGEQKFALAGGALGGFSGFLAEPYRHHDYLLGRRNCQQFLRKHFTLPRGNHLFDGWGETLKDKIATASPAATPGELPIIPLVGDCATPEPLPTWPVDAIDLDRLQDGVRERLDAVYGSIQLGWWGRTLLQLAWCFFLRKKLVGIAMDKIKAALFERQLLR